MSYLKFWQRWCARVGRTRVRQFRSRRTPRFSWSAQVLEERTLLSSITVTSLADNLNVDGQITLREALLAANSNASVDGSTAGEGGGVQDEIVFQPGLTGTIELAQGQLSISQTVRIVGLGKSNTTIDANELARVFQITSTAGNVTFEGVTITGGKTIGENEDGGGIRFASTGTLTLIKSAVTGNSTTGEYADGGGIFAGSGNLTLSGSTVSGNSTHGYGSSGGGIFAEGVDEANRSTLSLTGSTVSGNSTKDDYASGGGIFSRFGDFTLTSSTLSGNSTAGKSAFGGGLYSFGGNVSIESSSLTGNSTTGNGSYGGGIWSRGDVSLYESVVSGNTTSGADASGGGLYLLDADLVVASSTISGNKTYGYGAKGGGIFSRSFSAEEPVSLVLNDSTLSGNSTAGNYAYGGGIASRYADVTIDSSVISGNTTQGNYAYGGGVYSFLGRLTIQRSTITGNSTSGSHAKGGGIWNRSALYFYDSTVSGNSTSGESAFGGGLYSLQFNVSTYSSTFADNSTSGEQSAGGGIHMKGFENPPQDRPALTVVNSTLTGNTTTGEGGAGGGIYAKFVTVNAISSTIAGNSAFNLAAPGGGIASIEGSVSLFSSIVAANSADESGSADIHFGGGGTHTFLAEFSLIGRNDGTPLAAAPVGSPDPDGNLVGTLLAPIDPLLEPLADNGGPTRTRALLTGSPAINAGGNAILLYDQRGEPFPRVAEGGPDIGAYELLPSLVVTTADDEFDLNFDVDDLSLREALVYANLLPGQDTITFDPSLAGQTIDMILGQFTISDSVTIMGLGAAETIIDAQQISRVFDCTASAENVAFRSLTIKGGRTTGDSESGGGIRFQSDGLLSLSDATIIGNFTEGAFSHGGGIFSQAGDVSLQSSVVQGNSTLGNHATGGGIHAGTGLVSLTNSKLVDNYTTGIGSDGGGLLSDIGEVTLTDSTVSGNTTAGGSARGGGIFVATANLIVSHSTISNNATLGIESSGGGVYTFLGNVTLTNSTLAGNFTTGENSSGAGVYAQGGDVAFINSTISSNYTQGEGARGGGIFSFGGHDDAAGDGVAAATVVFGDVTFLNSIVAGNSTATGSGPDLFFGNAFEGSALTVQFSLIGSNHGTPLIAAPVGSPDAEGNLVGAPLAPIDPRLGPLTDNGGPTETMALLPGSPALDAAGSTALVTDQRGVPFVRNFGAAPDLGAFEAQSFEFVVTTTNDEFDLVYDPDDLSLREALALANANPGHDTITFAASAEGASAGAPGAAVFPTGTILLTMGQLRITDKVTITGLGAAATIIDAQELSRVFDITDTAGDVTFESLTIRGGKTTGNFEGGGGIRSLSSGLLTISHCAITENSTTGQVSQGGGIYSFEGDITLTSSSVSGNSTSGMNGAGGGISNEYGSVTLNFSTVSGNTTTGSRGRGGGVNCLYGQILLIHSTVSGNSTTGESAHGAGIYSYAAAITLTDSTVSGNSTSGPSAYGGGIYNDRGSITLIASTLSGNSTAGVRAFGGGIFADEATIHVVASTISGNSTSADNTQGGGIYIRSGDLTLTDSKLSKNTTAGVYSVGGGLYASKGDVTILSSEISENSTTGRRANGGGIYVGSASITITGSTVSGNVISGNGAVGAGINTYSGSITVIQSTISGNSAQGLNAAGGGIYSYGGRKYVYDEEAKEGYYTYGSVTIDNSIIAGNTSSTGNGPDLLFIDAFGETSLSVRFSLIGNNDGTPLDPAPVGFPDIDGNLIGSSLDPIDPLLGPLADNGGPTQTMALLPGSPARDAAGSTALPTDQRGAPFARVVGAHADMGAFEAQTLTLVVTTDNDELDGDYDANDLNLREALALANANPGHDTITFASSAGEASAGTPGASALPAGTIFLTMGQLTIVDTVTITGLGADKTIIDAQQLARVFDISSIAGDVTFESLTITGGKTTDDFESGGGIRFLSSGVLTIAHSAVSGNTTTGAFSSGGGIHIPSGNMTLIDSLLSENATTGNFSRGGGLYFGVGDVTINHSEVRNNSTAGAGAGGGGVYAIDGQVTFNGSVLSDNSTSSSRASGGGIATESASVTFHASTVSGNSTVGEGSRGGGIQSFYGAVTLINSTLTGNFTTGDGGTGGGINSYAGLIILIQSTVSGNTTAGSHAAGGGIYSYGGGNYVYDEDQETGSFSYGGMIITSSIVAGNTSNTGNGPDLFFNDEFDESILKVEFSLIGSNDGTRLDPAPVGSPDVEGNLIGTSLDPIDPLLGPLADNGGPTQTMALLPGSPARNSGSNALAVDLAGNPLPYDQRGSGFDRIFDGTVDMGAFEFSQAIGQVTIGTQQGTATYGTARLVTYQVTVFRATGFAGSFVAELSVVNSALPAGTRALFGASTLTFGENDDSLSTTLTIQTEFGGSHTPAGQFGFSVRAENAAAAADFATAERQLTVNKANATIVVSPYTVVFDGNPRTSTGSATGVFGEVLAGLDLSGTTHTAPGNYTDVWTFTDSTGNYFNAVGLVQNTIVVPLSTTFVRPRFVPTPISFAELQGGANIPIPSGHSLGFRVELLNGGTLQVTRQGQTTTATVGTLVVEGDTLIWTSPQGATGLNDAFRLAALDLSDNQSLLSLVQIKVNLVNVSPFLSTVTTFTGALQQTPFNITYEMLLGAANEFDANGDALGFRIRTVQNGTLTITKSGTDTPLPVVLAQTLVQPGDLLTWTGGAGQSGNNFPAFTVRAWDGQAGSGVDIQVTIDVTPFGSQFDLSGPWVAAGKLANINQAGSNLTITDENNALSAGLYTALNVISGRNGRTGVVDIATPDAGRIVWSDGAIWLKLSPGGQYFVSNPNRPNDPPALVRVIQNGGALRFYNRIGDSADATFISPTIIRIPKWQLTATYVDGALTISNGLVWRKLDLSPTYTESVSGLGTRVRQYSNLTSNTIELTFTDTVGGTSAGFWLSPMEVRATGWNSTGTVVDGQILWVGGSKDGEVWNKKLVLIGSGSGAGPGFVTIEATNSLITLTNKVGFVMQARILDPYTLFNVTTGKIITRKNGKLDLGNNLVWSDFDFNALDAVFADIKTFPFGV